MITLKEYNNAYMKNREVKHSLGIACDNCGSELIDTMPGVICTSNPPQRSVHCSNSNCGYKGYMWA